MKFGKRIGGAAALGVAVLTCSALSIPSAQAGYIVTLTQLGPNVVATGIGTINTTGLSFGGNTDAVIGEIIPNEGDIVTGPAQLEGFASFTGINGPASFGNGGLTIASSGSGDIVGIVETSVLALPENYVSGSPLSDSSTYDNQNFASLDVTPGVYVWTWGSGATADSFTLDIGAAPAVAEPASLTLLGVALAGLGVARRRIPHSGLPS
jgi:hypothetical protein